MIAELERTLLDVLTHYGLFIVFLATALENSLFVGVLIPGVAVLLAGGLLAAQGYHELRYVILLAFIGGLIGDNISYWLGRHGGRPVLQRYEKLVGAPKRLKHMEEYYESHGGKTVFIARFTAFVHTVAPLMAGVSRMTYPRFLFLNASSGAIWSVTIPTLGYFFGQRATDIARLVKGFTWYSFGLFALAIAAYVWVRLQRHRRQSAVEGPPVDEPGAGEGGQGSP